MTTSLAIPKDNLRLRFILYFNESLPFIWKTDYIYMYTYDWILVYSALEKCINFTTTNFTHVQGEILFWKVD